MDTFTKKETERQDFISNAEAMQQEMDQITKNESEIKFLKINLKIKENEIDELNNLLENHDINENNFKEHTIDIEKDMNDKMSIMEITIINLKKDNTHLRSQIQEKDVEINSVKSELDAKTNEVSRLRNRIDSYRTKKHESSLRFDSMKRPSKEVTYLKQKINFLIQKIEENNISLDHQDKNILDLEDIEELYNEADSDSNNSKNVSPRPEIDKPNNLKLSKFDLGEMNFNHIDFSELIDRQENKSH